MAFSRREQHGIIFLSVLIVLMGAARVLFPLVSGSPEIELTANVEDYFNTDENKTRESKESTTTRKTQRQYELTNFDPNKVTVTELHTMGLSAYVIVNWMKYLEAGGRFSSPGDIQKVYGVDSVLAYQMKPFVAIDSKSKPDAGVFKKSGNSESRSHVSSEYNTDVFTTDDSFSENGEEEIFGSNEFETAKIDINQANAEDFRKLRGIGEVFSKRIIAFRDLLGGFYEVDQLGEVYGISEELLEDIRDYLKIERGPQQKININKTSLHKLRAHPYLDFYQARDIIEYRKEYGSIHDQSVLTSLPSFDDRSARRVLPYLSFNTEEE